MRFSLKILKAKNEKGNLMYAPKPEAGIVDAATKLIGKKVIEQCQWKLWSSSNAGCPGDDEAVYSFEGLLPKPQCGM